MEPYEFIDGHDKVIARFGLWPSFHDGEVHRVVLDRGEKDVAGVPMPSVEIHVRGWTRTSKINDKGSYVQTHDSVVQFLFEGVFDLELDGFNQQNVLSGLSLSVFIDPSTNARGLHVELWPCYGLSGSFKALKARVVDVTAYEG